MTKPAAGEARKTTVLTRMPCSAQAKARDLVSYRTPDLLAPLAGAWGLPKKEYMDATLIAGPFSASAAARPMPPAPPVESKLGTVTISGRSIRGPGRS